MSVNNRLNMDASVSDLPGSVWIKAREVLDTNPAPRNWRALIGTLETSNMIKQRYKITPQQVELWAQGIERESAAGKLLTELGSQGMTVGDLSALLEETGIDTYLLGLSKYEKIRITQSPAKEVDINEGETLVLEIAAMGKPHPRFQWFFCPDGKNKFNELKGCTERTLTIANVTSANAGGYSCQIHNCSDPQKTRLTNISLVIIKPKPIFVSKRLNLPGAKNLSKMPHHPSPTPVRHIEQNHEIRVISHPTSKELELGERALFMVEAQCGLPLRYQWIKDGKEIKGANSFKYKIYNIQDASCQGTYQCEVKAMKMTVDGRVIQSSRVLTNPALLHLKIPFVNLYNPHDKVALLIGNSDYLSAISLKAPPNDIREMAESLVSINFKVVMLLNLTKPEIENAVIEFCKLIDKNVYVVFYFCGHGFEERGVSYLIPTDAPSMPASNECVNTSLILHNFQKKNPALVFLVLDTCRMSGKGKSSEPPRSFFTSAQNANVCYCYATSLGLSALENTSEQRGLLIRYLAPLLTKPIGIDNLVIELKEEFSRSPKHCDKQLPEIRSNVGETRRSLTDEITYLGQQQAYKARERLWGNYNNKPRNRDLTFPLLGIVLQLDFQSYYNNLLDVFVLVQEQGETQQCVAFISNFSPIISQYGNRDAFKRNGKHGTRTTLQDIQKLKDNLVVDISVVFVHRRDGRQYSSTQRVDLGLPLVSNLKLWKPAIGFEPTYREPIEQEETYSI
ncbi:mucosa-associated lymphoid tissue lymphoma translocation protein 1 homolog isoform X1 [Mya arenaria]|uniref:mucosa-associated lymphoid tissue lymphoma translocation protein 1 homolog isoform X1 n=2 Tax=Mya arenaria TaxID=6604 RepID=UPI0022DEB490|nr:mucosa-associated lymphoid tissue lymphoma translocation protein 1 homolog isoform X1 [Mya arenaria]